MAAAVGSITDSLLIGAVVVVNAMIGATQRVGADRALRRLVAVTSTRVRLYRDGEAGLATSDELVPGDVLELQAGDAVPADCRILEANTLEADESSLTGESMLVPKTATATPAATVADRHSMLYEGTVVAAGTARAVVVATGPHTQAGRGAWEAGTGRRPGGVETRLAELTRITIPITLGAGAALAAGGLLHGRGLQATVAEGVGLAVAAVPEGLPLVANAAQLAAARRLSRRGALIRHATSIEALGRVDVLCFDKTGTLTEGRIRLHAVSDAQNTAALPDLDDTHRRVLAAALRASPEYDDGRQAPHPTDRAVLDGGERAGVTRGETWSVVAELPFEPARGYHAAVGRSAHGAVLSVKGAPEVVLPRCTTWQHNGGSQLIDAATLRHLEDEIERLARRGYRVLAVAERAASDRTDLEDERVARLGFVGLVALADPVRPTAAAAVRDLRRGGVEIVMLTGDHPSTAESIAADLDLLDSRRVSTGTELDEMDDDALDAAIGRTAVFARVSPAQKVRIVRALHRTGRVVAVTGDGANDAPAIRLADVGVAVGHRATAAAREAADLVIADDRLETIVDALVEGRAVWGSVRDAISVLVGGNLGEILFTLLTGVLAPGGSALNARQLLLVNLLTDMLPSMALAVRPPLGKATETLLREGPDASLGATLNRDIVIRGATTAAAAGAAWLPARLTGTPSRAGTVALVALVGAQLGQTLVTGWRSPLVVGATVVSAAALVGVVQTPVVSRFFGSRPIGPGGWMIAIGSSVGASAVAAVASARIVPAPQPAAAPATDGARGSGVAAPDAIPQAVGAGNRRNGPRAGVPAGSSGAAAPR
nr:cation-translocating P-type ATPase [Pseudonocardia acidicola]